MLLAISFEADSLYCRKYFYIKCFWHLQQFNQFICNEQGILRPLKHECHLVHSNCPEVIPDSAAPTVNVK